MSRQYMQRPVPELARAPAFHGEGGTGEALYQVGTKRLPIMDVVSGETNSLLVFLVSDFSFGSVHAHRVRVVYPRGHLMPIMEGEMFRFS